MGLNFAKCFSLLFALVQLAPVDGICVSVSPVMFGFPGGKLSNPRGHLQKVSRKRMRLSSMESLKNFYSV